MLSIDTALYLQSFAETSFDNFAGVRAGECGTCCRFKLLSGSSSASPCESALSVGSCRRGELVKSLPEAGEASDVAGYLGNVYEDQREVLCAGSDVLKMSAPGGGVKVLLGLVLCGVTGLWCLLLDPAGEGYSSSLRWKK
jgi:hypothetical protein